MNLKRLFSFFLFISSPARQHFLLHTHRKKEKGEKRKKEMEETTLDGAKMDEGQREREEARRKRGLERREKLKGTIMVCSKSDWRGRR